MNKIDSQILPMPPNLLTSFRAGFDAIANKILIILIPITIDLILWLGPHLQVKSLVLNFLNTMLSSNEFAAIQPSELLVSSEEVIRSAASQYNLLSLMRTFPVGIPSIMSGRLPISIPKGTPVVIDITNPLLVGLVGIGILLVGLMFSCLFYLLVVQAAIPGKIEIAKALKEWPRAFGQVLSLTLALLVLFLVISIPASCAISAAAIFGLPLGQFAIFLYIGLILWLAFPLIFSAHGIFVNQNNALLSVQRSMMMTRMTLPTTALFILLSLVISEGLNMLWRVPPEASWLTLVGVGGHAFITSALLATSFVYYRDADRWTQETLKSIATQRDLPLQRS